MLVGVSLGPGDPGLLTLKAVDSLKRCQKIFVPGAMAANLAKPYCTPIILDFPMIEDDNRLDEVWSKNADIVASYAIKCPTAFACIGDVNTFSTFTHLKRVMLENHPEVIVETIPGVGIIPAMASRFGIGLDRSFQVSDGSQLQIIIRMKATRPRKIAQELESKGFSQFILGSRLCTDEEQISHGNTAVDMPERSNYFSVLYASRKR